jgi:putative flippase GtrA
MRVSPLPGVSAKYMINSVVATTTDFMIYGVLVNALDNEPVQSVLMGNIGGAAVSFLLLHHWVFRDASAQKIRKKVFRFMMGFALTMSTSAVLVAFIHHGLGGSPWVARLTAAGVAWGLGYWFNRHIVFKKQKHARVHQGISDR